jgi:hypothetical protein
LADLKAMKALFAEHDVEGFIGEGAPRDEYDQEATDVAQKLKDMEFVQTKIDCAAVLKTLTDVWSQNFNLKDAELEQRRKNLSRLAGKVQELWKNG